MKRKTVSQPRTRRDERPMSAEDRLLFKMLNRNESDEDGGDDGEPETEREIDSRRHFG